MTENDNFWSFSYLGPGSQHTIRDSHFFWIQIESETPLSLHCAVSNPWSKHHLNTHTVPLIYEETDYKEAHMKPFGFSCQYDASLTHIEVASALPQWLLHSENQPVSWAVWPVQIDQSLWEMTTSLQRPIWFPPSSMQIPLSQQ